MAKRDSLRPMKFLAPFLSLAALVSAHAAELSAIPFKTITGEETSLAAYKGKVVLVDFWASWCGPCKESFPAMNQLQQQFADKGVVILAINVDETKSDMDAFLKEHPASFTVVRDAKQKLVDKVEIGTMPSSFILNKDGKVMSTHSGFEGEKTRKQYEEELINLLK